MNEFRIGRPETLPVVIKNLLIINVLFFLAQNTLTNTGFFDMEEVLGLHNIKSPLFQPWQLITHLFLHGGLGHIFFNMFSLWMFGSILENLWGPKKFLTFYFICGLGAALLHLTFLWFDSHAMLSQFVLIKTHPTPTNISAFFNEFKLTDYRGGREILSSYISDSGNSVSLSQAVSFINDFVYLKLSVPTIGASGAIAGILAAFMFLYPNRELYLYLLIPVKAKWLGIIYFGTELYQAITNSEGDNVAHWAHLGGALVGFMLILTWNQKRPSEFY